MGKVIRTSGCYFCGGHDRTSARRIYDCEGVEYTVTVCRDHELTPVTVSQSRLRPAWKYGVSP